MLILQLKRFEEALDNTPEAAVDGSWRAVKRPDQVKLDHEITLQARCEGEAAAAGGEANGDVAGGVGHDHELDLV